MPSAPPSPSGEGDCVLELESVSCRRTAVRRIDSGCATTGVIRRMHRERRRMWIAAPRTGRTDWMMERAPGRGCRWCRCRRGHLGCRRASPGSRRLRVRRGRVVVEVEEAHEGEPRHGARQLAAESLSLIARRWIVVMLDSCTSVCRSDRSLLLMLRNSRSSARRSAM